MANLFTTFDELSPEAVQQLQEEGEQRKIKDLRDKGINDENILKEMQKATAAFAKRGLDIEAPFDPVEQIKTQKLPTPQSERFLTGQTYVSPRKGERNYFLIDDDNQGLDFDVTSYRKVYSTPTDIEGSIIGAPAQEPQELKPIPLFSGTIKVELPYGSPIEMEGAGEVRKSRSIYLSVKDKSREEISNMVDTFVAGEKHRGFLGAPEFPLYSDRNNPLTIIRNGVNLKVEGNLQTVKEFKTDPRLGLLRAPLNAVGSVVDFGGLALIGAPAYLAYGTSAAWNATGANVKRSILDGTVGPENWFDNEQYNKWHETISSNLQNHVDMMPDTGGYLARKILQYNVPTLKERIDGAADYTKDDLMRVLSSGTIVEDFVSDVYAGKFAYKAIDRLLGLVGYGPNNAVIFRKMFAGDVDINKKNIFGMNNRVGVRIRELNDYAKEKYGKPWLSGFQIWKNTTGGTKAEWDKLADAKKTPWINKSIGNFFQLSIEKDGGLFQKMGDFIRKGRLETGASLPVYNKMSMLSETYASAGGIALDSAGIPGGYLFGGILFGAFGPGFSSLNVTERFRRNRIGNLAVAGVDTVGKMSAATPVDALAFFFTGRKPFNKLEYESAVGKWKAANPDKVDSQGNVMLSTKELQEEVYNKYGVASELRFGTLPSFYVTQADGTRKLYQDGDKEHRLVQSYAVDLMENLTPEDIAVIRDQIGGFLQLQNDLADLMEKFPGQYRDNPENHPFYKMGLGLFEILNIGTSRQLAYQAAERINFGLAQGVQLGMYEKLYQKNLRMIEGLSSVLQDAVKFADEAGISQEDFSNIQPVLNKLGAFLDETKEFTEEAVMMPKILTEINGAIHGTGKYKEGLQFNDLDNEFQQYVEYLGLQEVFGDIEDAKQALLTRQQLYGKQILDLRAKLRDNPDAWNPEGRQFGFNKVIDIANNRIKADAQKIYAPLKNIIPNMAPIKGDDVDEFFLNVFDTLDTDPLERFTGAELKGHHKRGIISIFTMSTSPIHGEVMNQLRKTFDSDGTLRTQYENGDINLQEYNNAVISKFKEGVPEAEQYNFNNPISTYKFLVENKDNPLVAGLKATVGDITLDAQTIAEFDRVFRSNSSRIQNQMLAPGSDKQALSARLNKYTRLLGGRIYDEKGELTEEAAEGTLRNILSVRNGEKAIKLLAEAPKNYASAVAFRRWGKFANLFEAIDRIDTPLKDTKGFFNRANGIVYKKNYKDSLIQLGQMIIDNPTAAADMMKRKFGTVGRIQTGVAESGEPIYETVYVIADNKSAELLTQITKLAIDEVTKDHYVKTVDKFTSQFGKGIEKFADNEQFIAELNRIDGNALLPGGRVFNALEDYDRALSPNNNVEIWNGKMDDNNDFVYIPASEYVFTRNVQGEEKPNGKLIDQAGKRVFNYYDIRFSGDGEFLNFISKNKLEVVLQSYQKKIGQAQAKYTKTITKHINGQKSLYSTLDRYVKETLALAPRTAGQPPVMLSTQSAAKILLADGSLQNVKNFEEFLITAKNPRTGNSVLKGTFKQRQKEARKFISNIIRQNFVDEVLDITNHIRPVFNQKTKKFDQVQTKVMNVEKTNAAVDKYGDILREYLHSDLDRSKDIYDLFTNLAVMLAKMQSGGPSGGFDQRIGRALTKSVITNIPTPLTHSRMFNRFMSWKRDQISATTVGGEMSLRAMALNKLNESRIILTMAGSDFDDAIPGTSLLEALSETLEQGIFTPKNERVLANKLPFLIYDSNLTFDSYSLFNQPVPLGFDEEGDEDIRAQKRFKLRKIEEGLPENIRESESQPLFKEEQ